MSTVAQATVESPGAEPVHHFLQGGGDMGARMRALDWTTTPLGAPASWPQSLKTIVRVMLDSRYAMWMLWGPGMTFFCNDAYLPTVGIKRDWVLGARADKVWEEIWPDIGPRIDQVRSRGEATWDEALLLFLERSGFPEETYHTFSYSPVYDDDSRVAGMLCVVTEVTERVIGERRLRALGDLAARAVGVQSVEDGCHRACEVLARYPLDVPFAALYLIDDDSGRARRIAWSGELTAQALPASLLADEATSPWSLQRLLAGAAVEQLGDLPALGVELPAGPWPDRVKQALVLPLKASGHGLAGVLVAGCSPRRALDEPYRSFLELVAGQLASVIADAQSYEAERRRAETLGRTRSRQDGVLLQRQPRVPHAADVDARAAGGRGHRRHRAAVGAATARARATQCRAPAAPGDLAARLLAHRGRALVGELRSHRPGRADARPREHLPLGDGKSRAGVPRRMPSRSTKPPTSTARCGKRSSSTCCPTHSSSRSRAA